MKKKILTTLAVLSAVSLASINIACQGNSTRQSKVKFVKSGEQKAFLEKRNLDDTVLFGLNVIDTKGFFSTALNLNFRPVESRLVVSQGSQGQTQLIVATESKNGISGATIDADSGRDAGSWQTVAQPKVVTEEQDKDTVVVDLIHSVSFSLAKAPVRGEQTCSGEVKIRLFLNRQEKNP